MYNTSGFLPHCIFLILAVLIFSDRAYSQQGTVHYSHTHPVLSLPTEQVNELVFGLDHESITPTHVTVPRILFFDAQSSLMHLYNRKPYVLEESNSGGKDIGWEFRDTTFVHHSETYFIESREFDDNIFIVRDELPSWSWKLVPNTERIFLGYQVIKATSNDQNGTIEAWFTPEISAPVGPGLFHGLPGLVLMVTNQEVGEIYVAEKIDLESPVNTINPPIIGRQITSNKYVDIIDRRIAENQRLWEKAREAIINATPAEGGGNWKDNS